MIAQKMLVDLFEIEQFIQTQEADALRRRVLASLDSDGMDAHRIVFGSHTFTSPECHAEIIAGLHGTYPRDITEAFRGAAKSTLAEEAIALRMVASKFRYGLLLGNTYSASAQRLASIKAILHGNDMIYRLFGDQHGPIWNESKIKLQNGTSLACIGARQSIRGFKEEDARPDWMLIDDLEDEEWVKTPEAIEANRLWLYKEVMPALANPKKTPIRMIGTPLAENSLLRELAKSPEWKARRIPIRYINDAGELTSAWPEKFPLDAIAEIERTYIDLGAHRAFMQEYMCVSESEQDRIFTPQMLRVEPRVRVWEAVYAMIDPARTTKAKSAQTGRAVWSWAPGGRLSIWECDGSYAKPDEIVADLFRINEKYHPVYIGVEQDGLEEWMMQPIRDAQARAGVIPVRGLRAPRGKVDFIKGLQPFFKAGTAVFCDEPGDDPGRFANAFKQFLSFPRDVIDAPNALAYALLLRTGVPVYPDFSPDCIELAPQPFRGRAAVLCLNADGARVTAALIQDQSGICTVLAEWIEEGQPVDVVADIVRDANIMAGGTLVYVTGPEHAARYTNHGLNQALQRVRGLEIRTGGDLQAGRADVQERLRRRIRGIPALIVAQGCRFVLNGLAAGFAYPVSAGNVVGSEPEKSVYRTLIEGIETFMASAIVADESDQVGNWQTTSDGRRYRSARRQ